MDTMSSRSSVATFQLSHNSPPPTALDGAAQHRVILRRDLRYRPITSLIRDTCPLDGSCRAALVDLPWSPTARMHALLAGTIAQRHRISTTQYDKICNSPPPSLTQGPRLKKYTLLAALLSLALNAQAQPAASFGTFTKPFAADSPWNIRPIGPSFGPSNVLPKCGNQWNPNIQVSAKLGPPIFQTQDGDQPVVIYPLVGQTGLTDADARAEVPSVIIERFPANTAPAYGGDGHADIVDHQTGVIHSFWQLQNVDGKWRARTYAWSKINGKGWGDPSHYYQGGRATGVPTMAGVIRSVEVDDGEDMYHHALAMSLSRQGLSGNPTNSPNPAYIYPATAADKDSNPLHVGTIPEGALMMLPPDFVMQIQNPQLQKIVETLKTYGARVVDENDCTPYFIYVETGANFNIYSGTPSQNDAMIAELNRIRTSLRQVLSAYSYVDGNGQPTTTDKAGNDNLLSMRGPWGSPAGPVRLFNTRTQNIELPSSPTAVEFANGNGYGVSGGPLASGGVTWARPVVGAKYRFTVTGTGGASLRFVLFAGGQAKASAGPLTNGQSATVVWPDGGYLGLYAKNAPNSAGTLRATMIRE